MAKKVTVECHVCNRSFKVKDPDAEIGLCPSCGADLLNPRSETCQFSSNCNLIKSTLGIWPGTLYLTDQRLFWIKDADSSVATSGAVAGGLVGALVGSLVESKMNKDAGEIQMELALDQIGQVEESRKGVRKALTIHSKSGEAYQIMPAKREQWQEMLARYTV